MMADTNSRAARSRCFDSPTRRAPQRQRRLGHQDAVAATHSNPSHFPPFNGRRCSGAPTSISPARPRIHPDDKIDAVTASSPRSLRSYWVPRKLNAFHRRHRSTKLKRGTVHRESSSGPPRLGRAVGQGTNGGGAKPPSEAFLRGSPRAARSTMYTSTPSIAAASL